MKKLTACIAALTALLTVDAAAQALPELAHLKLPPKHKIDKRVFAIKGQKEEAKAAAATQPAITYHGGPVMPSGVNVYYIWYGNWASNSAVQILTDFMNNLGGSAWMNIQTTYYQTSGGTKTPIQNLVSLKKSVFDNYSRGKYLSDYSVAAIVQRAITNGSLPLDPKGVYFVLTSSDVSETSGFCSRYCGWHSYMTVNSKRIPYSFIGNPAKCLSACAEQYTGPNGNAGADGMASIIAHELAEIMTDPFLNAWYDSTGEENADKCAWTFGSTYRTPNGANANVKLGNRDYLIQQNWINSSPSGSCGLHYP